MVENDGKKWVEMIVIHILFFMAALSCMAGYASTELDRIGTRRFVLKVLASAFLIVMFQRHLSGYGFMGLLTFVAVGVCTLAV